MKGQELRIRFKEDMAFLTEEVALNFEQVQISDAPVQFKAPAFWTIRVINYIENEKRLFVEVIDYQVGETQFSSNQIQLADILIEIEKVNFKSIDTSGLVKTLKSIEPGKISAPKQEWVYRNELVTEHRIERYPNNKIYNEPFSILIKNVTFIAGGVSFEKKIQGIQKLLEFKILNENIIAEYDAIKNYFANVLKTKTIQIIPTITTVDGIVTSINATSTEIEKIDKGFIEEVKFEYVNAARSLDVPSDKQLFTMDEYLETFADDNFDNRLLFEDENHFFDNLLKHSKTKHYHHLRFLSSKHKHEMEKIHLIHRPFSFIFLLAGNDKYHVIWETLDTQEATYIWSSKNDLKNLQHVFTNVDKTINFIIKDGKNEYLNRKEENFSRVFHDYTNLKNGFKNWKEDIEKVIL